MAFMPFAAFLRICVVPLPVLPAMCLGGVMALWVVPDSQHHKGPRSVTKPEPPIPQNHGFFVRGHVLLLAVGSASLAACHGIWDISDGRLRMGISQALFIHKSFRGPDTGQCCIIHAETPDLSILFNILDSFCSLLCSHAEDHKVTDILYHNMTKYYEYDIAPSL